MYIIMVSTLLLILFRFISYISRWKNTHDSIGFVHLHYINNTPFYVVISRSLFSPSFCTLSHLKVSLILLCTSMYNTGLLLLLLSLVLLLFQKRCSNSDLSHAWHFKLSSFCSFSFFVTQSTGSWHIWLLAWPLLAASALHAWTHFWWFWYLSMYCLAFCLFFAFSNFFSSSSKHKNVRLLLVLIIS